MVNTDLKSMGPDVFGVYANRKFSSLVPKGAE